MALTLLSFGYHGWGPRSAYLVELMDQVERSRGFERPYLVDIRRKRQGRATKFVSDMFERWLERNFSLERYQWRPELGNLGAFGVQTRSASLSNRWVLTGHPLTGERKTGAR
jgi:hypothetical protein